MTSDPKNKTVFDKTYTDVTVARLSSWQVNELLSLGLGGNSDEADDLVAQLATLDSETAKQVMEDLRTPFASSLTGPLSIQRLTGANSDIIRQMGESSIIELLTAENTSRDVLHAMVVLGELLEETMFPLATRCTGLLTETVAWSAMYARHGENPTPEALSRIRHVFEAIEQNSLIAAFIQDTR
jgi:hypothetical protein